MKKIIKGLAILLICSTTLFLTLDDLILKKILIYNIESLTNKKAHINKLKISYFPNLIISISDVKIPNPNQDNYLLTSKDLEISIDVSQLFFKSLIINEIVSNSSIVLDDSLSTKTIDIKKEAVINNSNELQFKTNLMSKIKDVGSNLKFENYINPEVNDVEFDDELDEIENVVYTNKAKINEKKDKVISESNELLYFINSLSIENIKTVNQIEAFNTEINKINARIDNIKNEINLISTIYDDSKRQIDLIKSNIDNKIEEISSFNIQINQSESKLSIFEKPAKILIESITKRLKRKKSADQKKSKYLGKTYDFKTSGQPKFLIKKIQLNNINDDFYMIGHELTLSQSYKKSSKLDIFLKNQKSFKSFSFELNSRDRKTYSIKSDVNNLVINKEKQYIRLN